MLYAVLFVVRKSSKHIKNIIQLWQIVPRLLDSVVKNLSDVRHRLMYNERRKKCRPYVYIFRFILWFEFYEICAAT